MLCPVCGADLPVPLVDGALDHDDWAALMNTHVETHPDDPVSVTLAVAGVTEA